MRIRYNQKSNCKSDDSDLSFVVYWFDRNRSGAMRTVYFAWIGYLTGPLHHTSLYRPIREGDDMRSNIIILTVFFLTTTLPALGTEITVGAGGDYPTISQAVTAAISGDVITVFPGFYNEIVLIDNKDISLRSSMVSNPSLTVISGSGLTYGSYAGLVALHNVHNISIEGFTIQDGHSSSNLSAGLLLKDCSNVEILSCIIRRCENDGFFTSSPCQNIIVRNCLLENNLTEGAGLWYSTGELINCTLVSNGADNIHHRLASWSIRHNVIVGAGDDGFNYIDNGAVFQYNLVYGNSSNYEGWTPDNTNVTQPISFISSSWYDYCYDFQNLMPFFENDPALLPGWIPNTVCEVPVRALDNRLWGDIKAIYR